MKILKNNSQKKIRNKPKTKLSYSDENDRAVKRLVIESIEILSGRKKLERLYKEVEQTGLKGGALWHEILAKLEIHIRFNEEQLEKIPKEGPLIFIANHPFGVIDGLIMGAMAAKVRPNFFVLANEALCKEKLLNDHLLPIDFRETKEAMRTNIETRAKTFQQLDAGDILIIFPAGGVSTAPKVIGKAIDLEWKRFVIKVIQKTQATVVPVFFYGQNSRLFHLASKINDNLRLSLLLNEVRNKIGKDIHLQIGKPIPYEEIAYIKDRQKLLDHLRTVTHELKVEKERKVSVKRLKNKIRRFRTKRVSKSG